jgi:hypothetical protein
MYQVMPRAIRLSAIRTKARTPNTGETVGDVTAGTHPTKSSRKTSRRSNRSTGRNYTFKPAAGATA